MKKIAILGMAAAFAVTLLCAPASMRAGAEAVPVDVFIVAGQSNAAGYSNVDQATGDTNYRTVLAEEDGRNASGYQDVLYYGAVDVYASAALPAMKLTPVKMGLGMTGSHMGPELGMANALAQRGGKSAIIKFAAGGTYLGDFGGAGGQTDAYGNWASPSMTAQANGVSLHKNNGLLYERLLQTVESGISALKAEGYSPEVKGYIWMQGEADAVNASMAAQYGENLKLFLRDLRADVAELTKDEAAADRPFVIGKISPTGDYGGHIATVRTAEDAVCQTEPHVYAVETQDLIIVTPQGDVNGSDRWHFHAGDMYTLGKRFATCATEHLYRYLYVTEATEGGRVEETRLYSNGEEVEISYSAERGKRLEKVLLNGTAVPESCIADGVVRITPDGQTAERNTLQFVFTDATAYSLTVNAGAGGKISRSISGSTVYEGDELVVTVSPYAGYETEAVLWNGSPAEPDENGKYLLKVAGDSALSVTFKKTVGPSSAPPKEEGLGGTEIALIAVGAAVAVAACVTGTVIGLRRRKKK